MYRAAIAGLGNIAWKFDANVDKATACLTHAEAFRRHPGVVLCGGFATEEGDRLAFGAKYQVPVFESFEEMVQQEQPDIVSICSPVEYHFDQLAVCLKAGVPMIWLEKPPVASHGEMEALLRLAEGQRSKILVNFQRRYAASYQSLREIYRSAAYGACRAVQVNYSRGLEANGSHLLDLLFFVLGEEVEWEVSWVSHPQGEESPCFALAGKERPPVIVTGMSLPYHCIDITLIFEEGRFAVLHGGMTLSKELRQEHDFFPGFYRLKIEALSDLSDQEMELPTCMLAALEDLLAAHEFGQQPLSNLRTAAATMRLIAKLRERQGESPP